MAAYSTGIRSFGIFMMFFSRQVASERQVPILGRKGTTQSFSDRNLTPGPTLTTVAMPSLPQMNGGFTASASACSSGVSARASVRGVWQTSGRLRMPAHRVRRGAHFGVVQVARVDGHDAHVDQHLGEGGKWQQKQGGRVSQLRVASSCRL